MYLLYPVMGGHLKLCHHAQHLFQSEHSQTFHLMKVKSGFVNLVMPQSH